MVDKRRLVARRAAARQCPRARRERGGLPASEASPRRGGLPRSAIEDVPSEAGATPSESPSRVIVGTRMTGPCASRRSSSSSVAHRCADAGRLLPAPPRRRRSREAGSPARRVRRAPPARPPARGRRSRSASRRARRDRAPRGPATRDAPAGAPSARTPTATLIARPRVHKRGEPRVPTVGSTHDHADQSVGAARDQLGSRRW